MTETLKQDNLINGPSALEILNFLVDSGSIDLDGVEIQMKKTRRDQFLSKHPYSIYQDKDGRWRTYVKDEVKKHGRRAVSRASREELMDALYCHYNGIVDTTRQADITMASLYPDWIDYKTLHVADTTVDRVQRDWNKYYSSAQIVHIPLSEITKLDLDVWVHEMIRKHNMTKHKYANFILILRQELDYAVDRGFIQKNPFNDVVVNTRRVLVREHKKSDQSQVYTRSEFQNLQKLAWKDYETRHFNTNQLTPLAVLFMFFTGTRVGEVCAIKYSDIEGDILTVRRMLRHPGDVIVEHTKGEFGDRTVPLVPQALKLIEAAKERQQEENAVDDGYLFSMNDKPLLYTAVTKAFYRYCSMMGIEPKSSHKVRKTFVSSLIDGGVNINTIRQIVGHTDERTTLNNYCYDRSDKNENLLLMTEALG